MYIYAPTEDAWPGKNPGSPYTDLSDFALDLGVNLFFDTIQSYDGGL